MQYDAAKVAEQLNISKVTAYAKFKLPEVKPFIIIQDGKSCVDEKGLELIKQALKYKVASEEVSCTNEIEELKADMFLNLKSNIEFLKGQIDVKDNQIQDLKKLFENSQVLWKKEQDKNSEVLFLPETIKEHDIELINSLTKVLDNHREKYNLEAQREKLAKKGKPFSRFFKKKKMDSI